MMDRAIRLLQTQTMRYIIVGGLTTGVNFVSFFLLTHLSIDYRISNTLSFLLAAIFAYFMNEGFVFHAASAPSRLRLKRAMHFLFLRAASYAADMALMILLISVLSFHMLLSKIGVNIAIIIFNYIISKFLIFKEVKKP